MIYQTGPRKLTASLLCKEGLFVLHRIRSGHDGGIIGPLPVGVFPFWEKREGCIRQIGINVAVRSEDLLLPLNTFSSWYIEPTMFWLNRQISEIEVPIATPLELPKGVMSSEFNTYKSIGLRSILDKILVKSPILGVDTQKERIYDVDTDAFVVGQVAMCLRFDIRVETRDAPCASS